MAIQKISNAILYGVAADTKPTTYANNTLFFEQDTGNIFRYNLGTTTWVLITGASKTETLTNKTISGASNTISNVGKTSLPGTTVYTDQTNTFGAFAQIFPTSQLQVQNPAATFNYTIAGSAITAARTATLPLLAGNDTFDFQANTATLTNKTVNATNNTITDTSTAAGDLLHSNGTKFVRFGIGSGLQVLRTNTGATDIEWATISSYTEAKGTSTKSGDASTTTFTIAHTLTGTPSFYVITPTSTDADADFYLTIDSTNITVNYPFPPPSGTSNLTYVFRAAL